MNLPALLSIAEHAARRAADHLLTGFRKEIATETKASRIDLVTNFDRESEVIVREALARTPYGVVGEEFAGTADGSAPVWYVDPLDGTTNFVHGHPFYCVSLGLMEGDTPLLGVVVAPSLHIVWKGHQGGAASRNEEHCVVSRTTSLEDSLLATGFPYDRATSAENNFAAFVALKKRARGVRRCGSAAIDLCLVADGTYDGYWERKLKTWDLAAGSAIVMAAGGQLSSLDGGPARIASGNLVASNGLVHRDLVEAIAQA